MVLYSASTTYPESHRSRIDLENNPLCLIDEDSKEVRCWTLMHLQDWVWQDFNHDHCLTCVEHPPLDYNNLVVECMTLFDLQGKPLVC